MFMLNLFYVKYYINRFLVLHENGEVLAVSSFILILIFCLCSELNDTIFEAQLRTRQVPPALPIKDAVDHYSLSNNRLLILVFVVNLSFFLIFFSSH